MMIVANGAYLIENNVRRWRLHRAMMLVVLICFWTDTPAQQSQQQSSDTPGWAQPYSLQISPMCLNFMVVGICIWITCYWVRVRCGNLDQIRTFQSGCGGGSGQSARSESRGRP